MFTFFRDLRIRTKLFLIIIASGIPLITTTSRVERINQAALITGDLTKQLLNFGPEVHA